MGFKICSGVQQKTRQMSPITRVLCYLATSIIASLLSILIIVLIGGLLTSDKTMDSLLYTALLLVMRWLRTLTIGGILFAVLAHLINQESFHFWRVLLSACLTALLMVAFRESQTMFRYGAFSWEYLDDILRNSVLFIPYIFLVPLLSIPLIKILSRKPRTADMDILDAPES